MNGFFRSSVLRFVLFAASLPLRGCSPGDAPVEMVSVRIPLPSAPPQAGPASHVILISIDGLRPDAITTAPAPNLLALLRRGTHCPEAETGIPSVTLPSHASMLTGLRPSRHGMTENEDSGRIIPHPTILSMAGAAGLSTAMLFAKDKFHSLVHAGTVHWVYGPRRSQRTSAGRAPASSEDAVPAEGTDERTPGRSPPPSPAPVAREEVFTGPRIASGTEIAKVFSAEWSRQAYHLTFIHLGDPDAAGHRSGWMSDEYLQAVREADRAIGMIVASVEASPQGRTTAIIVTSDHGGKGKSHFQADHPRDPECLTVPWICAGPGTAAGRTIERTVHVEDTAPTVLALLGLAIPDSLDGHRVEEVLR